MNINISEPLKELRKKRGNTQEELATHIGISEQAVSKWERGESFPDITLLPVIAFYYNVSIDDLLGVGELKKQEKLKEYWEKFGKLLASNATGEKYFLPQEELWREAYKEFPNDIGVILSLMKTLFCTGQFEKNGTSKANELIILGEKVLKYSQKDDERYRAIDFIWETYVFIKKDKEKAKKYIKMLPTESVSTVHDAMPNVLEKDESLAYRQDNLLNHISQIYIHICNICAEYKNRRDKIKGFRFLIEIYKLLFENGDYDTEVYFLAALERLVFLYAQENEKDESLDCIELIINTRIAFNKRNDWSHTSFMVNKVDFINRDYLSAPEQRFVALENGKKANTKALRDLLETMEKSEFDFMRTDPRFFDLENKIKHQLN